MHDAGCVLIGLLVVLSPVILYIVLRLRSETAANAQKGARVERIHALLKTVAANRDDQSLREVTELLRLSRIGYVPELEHWFTPIAPTLRSLMFDRATSTVVEWYFECFSFPAGRQAGVLSWLGDFLPDTRIAPDVLQPIAERVLRAGGTKEAEWFYRRSLEALRDRNDPAFKAFVLNFGRLSYAFARIGQRPTVYDEQAIANDIAMNVR